MVLVLCTHERYKHVCMRVNIRFSKPSLPSGGSCGPGGCAKGSPPTADCEGKGGGAGGGGIASLSGIFCASCLLFSSWFTCYTCTLSVSLTSQLNFAHTCTLTHACRLFMVKFSVTELDLQYSYVYIPTR